MGAQRSGLIALAGAAVVMLASAAQRSPLEAQTTAGRDVRVVPGRGGKGMSLRLLKIYRLPMGPNAPVRIVDALLWEHSLYVLDGEGRRLLRYDHNGSRLVGTSGSWGREAGRFDVPRRIERVGTEIVVLDATHEYAISAFDSTGRFAGRRFDGLTKIGGTSFALVDDKVAIAVLTRRSVGRDTGTVIVANGRGDIVAVGCPEDPRYVASRGRGGELASYTFRSVTIWNRHAYCTQPVSPTITVFGLDGRTVASIRADPPFYREPRDTAYGTTATRREELDFEGRWSAHERVFVGDRGFVSVYSEFDRAINRTRYYLYGCDIAEGWSTQNCRAVESPGQPVRLLPPDTLLIALRPKPGANAVPWVAMYRVER